MLKSSSLKSAGGFSSRRGLSLTKIYKEGGRKYTSLFIMDISRKLKSQNVKAESMKRKTRTLCDVRYAVARKRRSLTMNKKNIELTLSDEPARPQKYFLIKI